MSIFKYYTNFVCVQQQKQNASSSHKKTVQYTLRLTTYMHLNSVCVLPSHISLYENKSNELSKYICNTDTVISQY